MIRIFSFSLLLLILSLTTFADTNIVSLKVEPGNTLVQGAAFKFTATPVTPSTSWRYKYLYYTYDALSSSYNWVTLSPWSSSPVFYWTPTTAQAGNNIQVAVYIISNTNLMSDQSVIKDGSAIVTISVRPRLSKVNLSMNPGTSASLGSAVKLSATTVNGNITTGAVVKYRFRYSDGNGWQTIQDYSLNSVAMWQPDTTGTYFVEVCAKEYSSIPVSNSDYDVRYQMIYKITTGASTVTTSLNQSTILLSNSVMINATTDIRTNAEYSYLFSDDNGVTWQTIQNYSTLSTAAWIPVVSGDFLIKTRVRSKGNLADYEAESTPVTLHVNPKALDGINITANPADSVKFGNPVTFTGIAQGGINTQYRISIKNADGNVVYSAAYQNNGDFNWLPSVKGNYAVTIDCKETTSINDYDFKKSINYQVIEQQNNITIGNLTATPVSPSIYTDGMSISVSANIITGIDPEYKFTYSTLTGEVIIKDYDTNSVATWSPLKSGNYQLKVYVRPFGNTIATPITKSIQYSLTDATIPVEITDAAITITENPPYVKNSKINITGSATGGKTVEYMFAYRKQSDGFTNEYSLKSYSVTNTTSFTPTIEDNYRIYIYVREQGTYVQYKAFSYKDITVLNNTNKPENVKATYVFTGVDISWNAMADSYKLAVRRRVYGARDWTILKSDIANTINLFNDGILPLSATTYEYQVGNVNKLSGEITWSDSAYLFTQLTWGSIANSAITFTAQAASQDTINVSWTLFPGVDGYLLQYSVDGTTWIDLDTNIAPTTTTYAHTYVNPDTTLQQLPVLTYRIQAFKNLIDSTGTLVKSYSNWLVKYESANIVFSWNDMGVVVGGFNLQYSADGNTWIDLVTDLGMALRTYTYIITIPQSNGYFYRVAGFTKSTDVNGIVTKTYIQTRYRTVISNNNIYKFESMYPVVPVFNSIISSSTAATITLDWASTTYSQFFEVGRGDIATTWITTGRSFIDGVKTILVNYPTMYQYKIRAWNEYHVSDWSALSSGSYIVPAQPNFVNVTPAVGGMEISWRCPSGYSFQIRRTGGNGGAVNYPSDAAIAAGTTYTNTYYVDNTVATNTAYTYIIRAFTPLQGLYTAVPFTRAIYRDSDPSTAVTTGTINYNIGLQIVSYASNNLNLSWTLHPDATATYDVQKWYANSISPVTMPTWSTVTPSPNVNIATYKDTTFPFSGSSMNAYTNIYMYRARVNPVAAPAGTSQWDIVRIFNVNIDNSLVSAVDNKDKTVTLTWPAVVGAKAYRIRRTGGVPALVTIDTGSTATTFIDGVDPLYPLEFGDTYYYYIQPVGDVNDVSTWDINYDAQVTLIPDKPVITSITVSAANYAVLNVSLPAYTDRYNVERLIGTTWQIINQNPLTGSPHTDTTVPPNSNAQYRVSAYLSTNPANISPYSDVTTFVNLAVPPTPVLTAFTASTINNSSIQLNWSYPANFAAWFTTNPYGVPSSYDIVYCTGAVPDWLNPAGTITVAGNLLTYSHTGLTPETVYSYRIYAYNHDLIPVISTLFASASTSTSPDAPVLTLDSLDCNNINLSWLFTPINAVSTYTLEIDKYDGAGWIAVTTPPVVATPYNDGNLLPGVKRNYRVRAVRTGVNAYTTPWSNTIITQTRNLPSAPIVSALTVNDTTIQLKWNKIFVDTLPIQTECIYKYKIKKITDNNYSAWIDINAPIDAGNNQYTFDINALLPNIKYHIYMQAVDPDGNISADSNIITIATLTGRPGLSLISSKFNSITVSWNAIAGAKSYTINVNPGTDINNINAALTQYEITALADNSTFDIKIMAVSDAGNSTWSDILTATTSPVAPTITVTKVDNANVLLNWNENYNPIITYNIERLAADGTIKQITSLASGITDNVVVAGATYKYRINVETAIGTSPWSEYFVYSLNPDVPILKFKSLSQTSIQIFWDIISNAQGYELQRLSGVNWIKISSNTPAIDYNLNPGTTYTYRVHSIGKNGTISDWASSDGTTKTAVPTGVSAIPNIGNVTLTWNDVTGETGYNIQRSTDGIIWGNLTDVGLNVTTYIDITVVNGSKYYYRIASFNLSGSSDYSTPVSTNSVAATPILTAQSASANAVYLTWTNVSGETGYEIQKIIGASWVTLKILATDITVFSDTNVTSGTTYSYKIRSIVNTKYSDWGEIKSVTTKPNVPMLTSVTNFDKSITLTWSDVSGENGYHVEKNINNAGWVLLTETNSLTFSINDSNVGNEYCSYRVSSFNAGGYSNYSNIVSTTTVPSAPVLTALPVSNILVTLSWPTIPNANYYELQRMVGNVWMVHGSTKLTQSYASGLKGSTIYKFRVRAYNNLGASPWSSEISVLTKPNPPVVTGRVKGLTTNSLSWSIIPGVTGYNVYRDNILLTNIMLSPATVTYTDKVASYSTSTYYVVAVNDSGNSGISNKVTLTTK